MSINLSVGANGATTGRTDQTIPGDGDIDTAEEATAALTLLPDGSTNTVKVGSREYTRAQLIEIRDRPAAPVANPAPVANGVTDPGPGVSHGVSIDGYYSGGLGSLGHSGGGARIGYTPGITVLGGDHRLYFDPSLGLDVGHFSRDYMTPGGEPANSAFTRYGGYLGGALRYAPPVLDHRLWASLGVRLGFGGFGTASSNIVSTPTGCTPGDFGRGECEPGAGPQTGNAGTAGLFDPRTGSSTGGSGAYFNFGIPLTIGGDVARGTWGNIQAFGGVEPNYTRLFPSGGQSFDYWGIAGFLGIRGNFGGGAVEIPRGPTGPQRDADTVDATATPVAPTSRDGHSLISLSADDIKRLANLPVGATILGVKLDGGAEDTTAPYEFDATNGNHTLTVRYTRPGETTERTRDVRIGVATPEPVVLPPTATGSAYGVVPTINPTVARPALTPGVAAGPLTIGQVEVTSAVPQGSVLAIFVDGNEVGTIPLQERAPGTDHNTPITIPAGTADGAHQIGVRIRRAGQAEVRFNDRPMTIGPLNATLSAASIPSNPPGGGHYYNDPIRIAVTSDRISRARITVGSYTEDVNLTAGANTITLTGAPRTWTTGGGAGRSTQPVRIQPLGGTPEALVGTAVDAGTVVIRRAGGGGRVTPAARPPRL